MITRLESPPDVTGPGLAALACLALAVLVACDTSTTQADDPLNGGGSAQMQCSIPFTEIMDIGLGRDGIPSLDTPDWVDPSASDVLYYLEDDDRVIGLVVGDEVFAVPHNVLWWHEILNLSVSAPGGPLEDGAEAIDLAITYCPLTGSSMAFDRAAVNGATLGVSGLIFQNNLIMWDRREDESLWPQMMRQARCGPEDGTRLEMYPLWEMTWEAWRELHPDTRVLSGEQGVDRDYTRYPYGDYEDLNNESFLFPIQRVDDRRPPKERVLGIPVGAEGGIAFPFGALEAAATSGLTVEHTRIQGEDIVVFWDSDARAAMAYRSRIGNQSLDFVIRGGAIEDRQTTSRWTFTGEAVGGPLEGSQLQPIPEAYVAFWFAWAEFHPATELWEG